VFVMSVPTQTKIEKINCTPSKEKDLMHPASSYFFVQKYTMRFFQSIE